MMSWEEFHFIRPLWLLAIPILAALVLFLLRSPAKGGWDTLIPEPMLKALMKQTKSRRNSFALFGFLAAAIVSVALAGPTWDRYPQPAAQSDKAVVILFDLSPSMLATDIAPSRLTRARLKIIDLLRARLDGQTALIAYAGGPHTVSPLTIDARSMESLVPVLHPNIMPVSGSNTEAAVAQAAELLENGDIEAGDILLVTDGVEPEAQKQIQDILPSNVRLSILGVGTVEGAPIPEAGGGFMRNSRDEIVIARLNQSELAALAQSGRGTYVDLRADDIDIDRLSEFFESGFGFGLAESEQQIEFDIWHDRGPWLVLLLLPLLAYSFRRGMVFAFLFVLFLPYEQTNALEWDELWLNSDQRGAKALDNDEAALAAEEFKSENWQGFSHYKSGDYDAAVERFENDSSVKGRFNLGNSYTHLGEYDKAIEAYDQALAIDPELEGAAENRAIAKMLKEMQEQSQQSQNSDQSQQSQDQNSQGEDGSEQQSEESSESQEQSGDNQQQQASDGNQEQSQGEEESGQQGDEQASNDEENQSQAEEGESEQGEDSESTSSSANADASEEEPSEQASQQSAGEEIEAEMPEGEQQSLAELPTSDEDAQRDAQNAQWLRAIPDDPGGLLRNKFEFESQLEDYLKRNSPPSTTQNEERY